MLQLDAGGQWRAALSIYEGMDAQGLRQDAITCSSLISASAKGKQWILAVQVKYEPTLYSDMPTHPSPV